MTYLPNLYSDTGQPESSSIEWQLDLVGKVEGFPAPWRDFEIECSIKLLFYLVS
jgi:hypothetical protein